MKLLNSMGPALFVLLILTIGLVWGFHLNAHWVQENIETFGSFRHENIEYVCTIRGGAVEQK